MASEAEKYPSSEQRLRVPSILNATLVRLKTIVGFLRHMRQQERSQEQIRQLNAELEQTRRLAYLDGLTGLPNRSFFQERLTEALSLAKQEQRRLGILFFGLDGFKLVNESLGHSKGDELLKEVGARLQRHVRPSDLLARFGGDEFMVLLRDLNGIEEATSAAERLLGLLRQPIPIDGRPRFVSSSAGVVLSNPFASEPQAPALLQAVDVALHQAKMTGKARAVVFQQTMTASARSRLDLETDLRQALAHDEFVLYYQPLLDCATGTLLGMEALLRWQHPRRGLLLPDTFIGLAEETGVILQLGRWVLEQACHQASVWRNLWPAKSLPWLSVNVSVRELLQPGLANRVRETLEAEDLEPECLKLEITESAVMQDAEFSIATLRALKDIGVRLAIDDFGTGYSSLSYLRRFPVDTLKIDHSFVSEIDADEQTRAIVAGIIELAHALGMDVTAEGVETAAQSAWLRTASCDRAQGFYYHAPMSAERITQLLGA